MDQDADSDKFGEPHLWGDLMERHARAPLHALVGGGDQLYNDALWTAPSLRTWLGGDGQHPGTVYSDDVSSPLYTQRSSQAHACSVKMLISAPPTMCLRECWLCHV